MRCRTWAIVAIGGLGAFLGPAFQLEPAPEILASFVIAAICKDGIVISIESRADIFDARDPKKRPVAY